MAESQAQHMRYGKGPCCGLSISGVSSPVATNSKGEVTMSLLAKKHRWLTLDCRSHRIVTWQGGTRHHQMPHKSGIGRGYDLRL